MKFMYLGKVLRFGTLATALLFPSQLVLALKELPQLPKKVLNGLPEELRSQVVNQYKRIQTAPKPLELGQLAMLLQAHRQYGFAELLYHRVRTMNPEAFEWAYYLAVVQMEQGKSLEARESLREALSIDSSYVPARTKLAELLFEAGLCEESRDIYLSVLQEYPELAVLHFGLGKSYQALGDFDGAIREFRQACELFEGYGPAHYALGQAYRNQGDLEKARQELSAYQKNRLRRPVIGDGLLDKVKQLNRGTAQALDYLEEGVKLGDENRLPEAIEAHKHALELAPELLQAYINLIILYGKANQPEKAEAAYRDGLALGSDSAELHYNFGVVLLAQNRYDEAARLFRMTLQINPLHESAHNNLGQILDASGKEEDAAAHFRKAIEIDGSDRKARFNLARILIRQGKLDDAIAQLKQTLQPEDADSARYTYALAAAFVRSGDLDNALQATEKAKELATRNDQVDLARKINEDLARLKQAVSKRTTPQAPQP